MRPLGARCAPLFVQSGHSQVIAVSRTCCFALALFGLMRMESKNLDESIGMADFDYAMQKASSLDIANTLTPDTPLTNCNCSRIAGPMSTERSVKQVITNKLRETFAPESLDVIDESHLHE